MLFEASNRKLGLSGLLSLAFSLAFEPESRAGGPRVTTEKGKPGSGIKKITRYQAQVGADAERRFVETSRHTVYTDGRDEWRYFNEEGRAARLELRHPAGHKMVILNVDVEMPSRISLGGSDELYLVSDAPELAPVSRTYTANMDNGGVITTDAVNVPILPLEFKSVAAFKSVKSGVTGITIGTTVVTSGPSGSTSEPHSATTTRVVEVVVR